MVQSFLKYLEFEKRYSTHTISSYRNDLKQFQEFITQNTSGLTISQIGHREVRAWLVELVGFELTPRTINRKIATLRSYFKFLLRREHITTDPMLKIRVLKTAKKLPVFVKEPEIMKILDQLSFSENFSGHRDQLIMELLYGTGIRLSELIQLKETDVQIYDDTLKVLGKRNKERIIPFSRKLGEVIQSYLSFKKEEFDHNTTNHLLVTNKGAPCYPMMIYRVVKECLDSFITLDQKSPHVLRHTFATHLLDKGAELNAVKDLLGHTSLAATQVYTHNTLEKLKKAFDQAHPKA